MKLNKKAKSILLAITVLFVICFKSLHVFIDSNHHLNCEKFISKENNHSQINKSDEKKCSICDFEFASFLKTEIRVLNFLSTSEKIKFYSNFYQSVFLSKKFKFYSKRGPPKTI